MIEPASMHSRRTITTVLDSAKWFVLLVVLPASSTCQWAEDAVLNRTRNNKSLKNAQRSSLAWCVACIVLCVCFVLVAHIPVARAVGFLPTSPAPSASSTSWAVVLAGVVADLDHWLSSHSLLIDVLHRLFFTVYFMAAAAGALYCLCVSMRTQSGLPTSIEALRKHHTWWWAACLQAVINNVCVTLISFVGYAVASAPSGVAVLAAWRGFDVYILFMMQGWYSVQLLVYKYWAVGGRVGPSHVQGCLNDTQGPAFFLTEVRRAALLTSVWFLLFVGFGAPFMVLYVWPAKEGMAPAALATGCRLSWQVSSDSWYSCTLLANQDTHLRILAFLLTMFISELLTVVWGAACWSTAVAGGPDVVQQQQQQQSHWKVVCAVAFVALCVLQNVTSIMVSLASLCRRQQQAGNMDEQQQQQPDLPSMVKQLELRLATTALPPGSQQAQQIVLNPGVQDQLPRHMPAQDISSARGGNANAGFAKWWSLHRSASCFGMILCRVYFLALVGTQGLQVNPFRCRYELTFFVLAIALNWAVRIFTGMMAWCQIGYVPRVHQA